MEVVAQSPLPVASQLWQSGPGSWVITFIAKATFDLQPERAKLSAHQEPIHEQDRHWDDDPVRSVYAPRDLAPLKNRADVVLVGSAYAPKGQAVRSLFARLIVGEIDKSIEVHVDRIFARDGSIIEGPPFTRMAMGYERAAGGPGTANPIGMRLDVGDGLGRVKLPNLQPPGLPIYTPGMVIPPVGFGPLAETWPVRSSRLGRYASTWSPNLLRKAPVPEDLDRAFFNAAPPDQQLAEVADDRRLVLDHLHPEWPRLITQLPGVRPRAVLDGRGGLYPLKMRADTLWIDSDRGIACLTFRSHRTLARFDEPGRILISMEEAPPAPSSTSLPIFPNISEMPAPKKKAKVTTLVPNSPEEREFKAGLQQGGALPFVPAGAPAPIPRDERPPMTGGLPFANAKPVSAPAPIPAPPPTTPPHARHAFSEWPESSISPPSRPVPAVAPPVAPPGLPSAAPAPVSRPSPPVMANSTGRAASRLDARDILHLIWYHAGSVARICKVPVWRAILDDIAPTRPDEELDDPVSDRDPVEIENTRDISAILTQAASEDLAEVMDELAAAVRPGNKFVPPLLLLSGDLSFPFDERETLRTAVTIATPLATTDEAFKNAVKEAQEFLASGEDQSCPPPLVEVYTMRIRETFQRSRRTVPADTLDLQMERALLEGRHYQKRQVFGMNAIRALLHTTTGQGSVIPAPVYIPDDIAKKLPLYQRFRARIIVELYFQEDQYESHPAALKALAIGRVQQVREQKK